MQRLLVLALCLLAFAARAGDVIKAYTLGSTGTATFTSASPTVVTVATWATPTSTLAAQCTANQNAACAIPVNFTNSGGALPTGISAATTYYIVPTSVSGTTFKLATTAAKAIGGTADVNTSDAGTGTTTAYSGAALTSTTGVALAALNLPVGEFRCAGSMVTAPGSGTTTSDIEMSIGTTEATVAASNVAFNGYVLNQATIAADKAFSLNTGTHRRSLTRPTILYLNGVATFAVATMNAYGILHCEKVP